MKLLALLALLSIGPISSHAYDRFCNYDEYDYLDFNQDVANAVRNGNFRSGYDHYIMYGQYENRITNHECVVDRNGCEYDEYAYLNLNRDVADAVYKGNFRDGADHYGKFGRFENRLVGYCGSPNPYPNPNPYPYPHPNPGPNPYPHPEPGPNPWPHPNPNPHPNPGPNPYPHPNPGPNPYPNPHPNPGPNPHPQPSPGPMPGPHPRPPHLNNVDDQENIQVEDSIENLEE